MTETRNEYLISNHMICHCGQRSPLSANTSWWKVQEWWREHGYGRKCT